MNTPIPELITGAKAFVSYYRFFAYQTYGSASGTCGVRTKGASGNGLYSNTFGVTSNATANAEFTNQYLPSIGASVPIAGATYSVELVINADGAYTDEHSPYVEKPIFDCTIPNGGIILVGQSGTEYLLQWEI